MAHLEPLCPKSLLNLQHVLRQRAPIIKESVHTLLPLNRARNAGEGIRGRGHNPGLFCVAPLRCQEWSNKLDSLHGPIRC